MASIKIARVYEATPADWGPRILVDRLWPRGLSKEAANLDDWWKHLAPSNELRIAYHAGEITEAEFTTDYMQELQDATKPVPQDCVLLTAAKEEIHASILRDWLLDSRIA